MLNVGRRFKTFIKGNLTEIFIGIGLVTNALGIIFRYTESICGSVIDVIGWVAGVGGSMVDIYRLSKEVAGYETNIQRSFPYIYTALVDKAGFLSRESTQKTGLLINGLVITMYFAYMMLMYVEVLTKKPTECERQTELVVGIFGITLFLANHFWATKRLNNLLQERQRIEETLKRKVGIEALNEQLHGMTVRTITERLGAALGRFSELSTTSVERGAGVSAERIESISWADFNRILLEVLPDFIINPNDVNFKDALTNMMYVDNMAAYLGALEEVEELEKAARDKQESSGNDIMQVQHDEKQPLILTTENTTWRCQIL